ncbi:Morn repeat domain containing protein [Pandoravirus neocaledonia]|uniref:Morn repeat domain containing protein n=1 Tax=Pandoravirus neocaledonia TaxID=2107708 RepID=A0A2U7UD75_9VIRU|nr:Morn repeat domain containing protein [Pandoravirus neocaledonia]AVK76377.1 Morn repeat domain containing protein [Pandoravirus neocaledonia]
MHRVRRGTMAHAQNKDNKRKHSSADGDGRADGIEIIARDDNNCAHVMDTRQTSAKRQRREAPSPFSLLPDEVILAILTGVDRASTLGAWSLTCKRHAGLALDASLWRRLCETHFGPLLHQRFAAFGKTWRWLYRAQAIRAPPRGPGVGAVPIMMRGDDAPWVYWGDTRDGIADGYGVVVPRDSAHCESDALTRVDAAEPVAVYYEGGFSMGMCHGWCRRVDAEGNEYVGAWSMGKRHGRAVARYACGQTYDGEWNANFQHGYGVTTYPLGSRYEGEMRYNMRHGRGIYEWADGARYCGDFEHDLRHGHGEMIYKNGDRYVGAWDRDRRNGYGVETLSNGVCFAGMWRDEDPYGYGVRVDPSGKRLYGEWIDGKPIGRVLRTHPIGRVLRTHPDGLRYVGAWTRDKGSSGYGTCLYPDGSRLTGLWSGAMCIRGRVVTHRAHGPPCVPTLACAACTTAARGSDSDI